VGDLNLSLCFPKGLVVSKIVVKNLMMECFGQTKHCPNKTLAASTELTELKRLLDTKFLDLIVT
jgi:hypothetical protein